MARMSPMGAGLACRARSGRTRRRQLEGSSDGSLRGSHRIPGSEKSCDVTGRSRRNRPAVAALALPAP